MQEVDLARSHELGAEAEASSAEQRVEAAGSRYQSALANLVHETAIVDYITIVAPFDGVVTTRDEGRGGCKESAVEAGSGNVCRSEACYRRR